MGWLKIGTRREPQQGSFEDLKISSDHIENATIAPKVIPRFEAAPKDTPDQILDFIPASEVAKRTSAETGGLRKPSISPLTFASPYKEISDRGRQYRLRLYRLPLGASRRRASD
jgi:hypothetical protein